MDTSTHALVRSRAILETFLTYLKLTLHFPRANNRNLFSKVNEAFFMARLIIECNVNLMDLISSGITDEFRTKGLALEKLSEASICVEEF